MKSYFLVLIAFVLQVNAGEIFKGCIDSAGKPVTTVYNNSLNNMAFATVTPAKKPIIIINSKAIAPLSRAMQAMIYNHECGHHALGHLVQQKQAAIVEEQAADCYGIRVSLTLGLIQHSQLPALQEEVSRLGVGDWEHLSGGSRAINIQKCLADGYAEENWNSCKTKFYSNVDFINKSAGVMSQLLAGCKSKGFKNPDCLKAKALATQLNDGLLKTVGEIDEQCPYVMAPSFNEATASYSLAFTQLLNGK